MKGKPKKTTVTSIRANLMKNGETLTSFARRHGFSINTVHKAMREERRGPVSREIMKKLKEVAR